MRIEEAIAEGKITRRNGEPQSINPYRALAEAWDEGWEAANKSEWEATGKSKLDAEKETSSQCNPLVAQLNDLLYPGWRTRSYEH